MSNAPFCYLPQLPERRCHHRDATARVGLLCLRAERHNQTRQAAVVTGTNQPLRGGGREGESGRSQFRRSSLSTAGQRPNYGDIVAVVGEIVEWLAARVGKRGKDGQR
jgi:hypothetical protein